MARIEISILSVHKGAWINELGVGGGGGVVLYLACRSQVFVNPRKMELILGHDEERSPLCVEFDPTQRKQNIDNQTST